MLFKVLKKKHSLFPRKFPCLSSDSRGFSLLELIIGVLILSVIISPLIHSMVTAATLSKKSRDLRDATLASQNVVETILSRGLDRLLTELSLPAGSSLSGLVAEAKLYKKTGTDYIELTDVEAESIESRGEIYYIGLKGIETPKGSYDAMVTLDAAIYATNLTDVSVYTEMDGAFSQPSDPDDNPDLLAAAYFADQATLLTDSDIKIDRFIGAMDKVTTIRVEKVPDYAYATTGVVIVSVEMSYTAIYDEETFTVTYDTEFYRNLYDENSEADNSDGIGALFYFYYPNYGKGDNIYVYNNSGIDFSLFIVKQKTVGLSDAELMNSEQAYKTTLELHEPLAGADSTPHCSICSNISTNLLNGDKIYSGSTYRVYKGSWFFSHEIPDKLVYTEKRNRIYDVKVNLYVAGASFADNALITGFKSSQVE